MNCLQFERDMELTCSGTESCDVRIMASAIPWAYQGQKEGEVQNMRKQESHQTKKISFHFFQVRFTITIMMNLQNKRLVKTDDQDLELKGG